MNVPLFDMAAELAAIRPELDAAIARVLDSGVFIGGPEVAAFERELAQHTGAAHAIGTSSGTDALLVTFMALGIGPGDEVVVPALTFFATAGSPARLGARIVFADIDEDTLTLDPAAAHAACTSRTKAIVPVHLFGRPAAEIEAPCAVVEDAAHSLGAPASFATIAPSSPPGSPALPAGAALHAESVEAAPARARTGRQERSFMRSDEAPPVPQLPTSRTSRSCALRAAERRAVDRASPSPEDHAAEAVAQTRVNRAARAAPHA